MHVCRLLKLILVVLPTLWLCAPLAAQDADVPLVVVLHADTPQDFRAAREVAAFLPMQLDGDDWRVSLAATADRVPPDTADAQALAAESQRIRAVVWLERSMEGENILTLYMPERRRSTSRTLKTEGASAVGSAALAALFADMILRAFPPAKDEPQVIVPPPIVTPTPAPEPPPAAPAKKRKLTLAALGQYSIYPETDMHQAGFEIDAAFMPSEPLAVHLGLGYLNTISLDNPRYNLTQHVLPITVGARYLLLRGDHEVDFAAGLIGEVSLLSFSDRHKTLASRTVVRFNAGLWMGMGYFYYVHRRVGLGGWVQAHYLPRTQSYYAEGNRIFHSGPFPLRFLLGIQADFLR